MSISEVIKSDLDPCAIREGRDKVSIDGETLVVSWFTRGGALVVRFFARETAHGQHTHGRSGGNAFRSAKRNVWSSLHDRDAAATMLRAAQVLAPGFTFVTYKDQVIAPGAQWRRA